MSHNTLVLRYLGVIFGFGPQIPYFVPHLCHKLCHNLWHLWHKFFCATFCGTYFLYFTCDPLYSSHFWIPDPLFCGTNSTTICDTCGIVCMYLNLRHIIQSKLYPLPLLSSPNQTPSFPPLL